MSSLAIGAATFVCVRGGAFAGMGLRAVLPEQHLDDASKDTIKLVTGLMAMFAGFGLFAPRHATAFVALAIGAAAVSTPIFLIEEMSRPLDGMIAVAGAPLRDMLTVLGK
jgi:hypothetical protein